MRVSFPSSRIFSDRKFSVLLWLVASLIVSEEVHAQVAVIVNSKNPVESLTKDELRRIYLGEMTGWDFADDRRENIILIDYKGEVEIGKKFYEIAVGMSPIKVRMKWLGKILNGEFKELPMSTDSERKLVRFVAGNVGAIGFLHIADLYSPLDSVKIVKIDGKGIRERDYPIQ